MANKNGKKDQPDRTDAKLGRSSTESSARKAVVKTAGGAGASGGEGTTVIARKTHDGGQRKAVVVDDLEAVKAARKFLKDHGIVPLVETPAFKKWFSEHRTMTFHMFWQEITLTLEGATVTYRLPAAGTDLVEVTASFEKEVSVSGQHWDLSLGEITLKHYYEQSAMVVEVGLDMPDDLDVPIEATLAAWGRYKSENLLRPSERGIEGFLEILEMLFGPIRDMSE
jgi:hypothetical protein